MFVQRELASIALCWRLERQDGVAIGFTAHDRDIWMNGLLFRAAPGMVPSKITRSDGLESALLDVAGALTSDAIREDDLIAGRWDGARVTVFMADWERPEEKPLVLARGRLGEVRIEEQGFEAELRSELASGLNAPVGEQTSPECRAELGDRRCGVAMRARTRIVRAAQASVGHEIRVDDGTVGSAFAWGTARWLSGANGGLGSVVLTAEAGLLTLRDAPVFEVAAGDLLELREGCDKAYATCTGRFGNGANFRGEPFLPGMDLLTRYSVG